MKLNMPADGEGRGKVALAAVGIVLLFAFFFFAIVSIAHHTGHLKTKNATGITTTSTTLYTPSTSALNANGTPNTTAPPDQGGQNPESPEGATYTPQQLAENFPQDRSNLTPSLWNQANAIGTQLVQTDTSGVGAGKFPDYYARVPAQHWLDNLNIEWVYSNESVQGVIEVQVWYTGVEVQNGQQLQQVEQDVYLDKNNNLQPIPFDELAAHSVHVDPTCCTFITP